MIPQSGSSVKRLSPAEYCTLHSLTLQIAEKGCGSGHLAWAGVRDKRELLQLSPAPGSRQAYSSAAPSRTCLKEKGENLKPAPS